MEEVYSLLGVSDCAQCVLPAAKLGDPAGTARRRSFPASLAAVRAARARLALGWGNKGAALAILSQERLLPVHLKEWNPFFFLANVDFASFPMDRLHGVYAPFPLFARTSL